MQGAQHTKRKKGTPPGVSDHLLIPIVNYRHQLLFKEAVIWRRISHPNVVQFIGVWEEPTFLCTISEWMPNGNVRDYVREDPEASRLQLVRRPQKRVGLDELTRVQLLDISRGLSFLHSLEIVHGDLKGVRPIFFPCHTRSPSTTPG